MSTNKLYLTIVSQEKKLFSSSVDLITAPASEGEITILPNHIPLMSKLNYGELKITENSQHHSIAISKGFINIQPNNQVTIIVDAAQHVRDISLEKAQKALEDAKKTMEQSQDKRELIMAEASLRQALWEIKLAQKTKKSQI